MSGKVVSLEYILKVNAVSVARMGKHPTINSNTFTYDERELLVSTVVEVMKLNSKQLDLEFNTMSMCHVYDPTYNYAFLPKSERNDQYDDDLSMFIFKD
jgi:hypothetical protein